MRSVRRLLRVLILGMCLLLPAVAQAEQAPLPPFDEVRSTHLSSYAVLQDREGQPLSWLRLDLHRRQLDWLPLERLSPGMQEALLVAEDRRFYQHGGIDWRAFAAAVVQNLWFENSRGASTLTMQLAGLLDPRLRAGGGRRSLSQKWDQALAATELERAWSKQQILEAYLNLAPLRGNLVGVPAAARFLFNKDAAELDHAEAAVLAVLLRGPNAPTKRVGQRACVLLDVLARGADCPRARELSAALDTPTALADLAEPIALRLLQQPGEKLRSTLDSAWQRHLRDTLPRGASSESAALVLEQGSGDVLAWASTGKGSDAPFAFRPLRNTLRTLALGEALGQGRLTAATLLPRDQVVGGTRLKSWHSVRTLFVQGEAAGRVDWGVSLRGEAWLEPLRRLARGSTAGAASVPTAGTGELRADLPAAASLWRAVAARGEWRPPRLLASDAGGSLQPLSPQGAFLLLQLLEVAPDGWHVGYFPESGGRWLVAMDDRITLLAWRAGEASRAEDLRWLHALLAESPAGREPARPLAVPEGVEARVVAFEPPVEPPRQEWFLAGAGTQLSTALPLPAYIRSPANGSLVRPLPGGVVRFESDGVGGGLRWRLDGEELGEGSSLTWPSHPGLFVLELLDEGGRVLDTVNFAVGSAPSQGAQQQP